MGEVAIRLRPWAEHDGEVLQRLLGDPESMSHLGGPESREAIDARHARYLAADPLTNGLFAIEVVGDRGVAGWVGFWESEWEDEPVWEIGWHVLPEYQGRGVGASATRLALAEAARRCRHRFVDAFPSVDNAPSNALCRTVGFRSLGIVKVEYPAGRPMRSNHWRFDLEGAANLLLAPLDGDTAR